jgi:hypothetical protein
MLQSCINCVAKDENIALDLRHNSPWEQLENNEESIVWDEPILDESWNELCNGRKQLVVTMIYILNVEIKKERLATLVAMFLSRGATNVSTHINFVNANLCGEGIISLSKLVETSLELQEFRLNHNRIDNIESVCCLSRSLKSHACIIRLNLSHCELGSSPEILLVILQSDVEKIILNNNNIDSLGAVKIAEYLECDPPITHLDLGHNRLNDNDSVLISQALKRNTILLSITLYTNNMTSIGVKEMLTCAFDSSSLNAISESNHTLKGIHMFTKGDDFRRGIHRLLAFDRTQKILLALQDKASLPKYLKNVPVELIPEVLAIPHGRAVDEHNYKYLNIVYSIMRWWNMHMLYSYHNCDESSAKRKRED